MTDNEIIKALEDYIANNSKDVLVSRGVSYGDILGIINRQKAEIERLDTLYSFAVKEREANVKGFIENLKTAKSEDRKEFAERLKEKVVDKKYKYVTETNYSKTVNSVIDSCIVSIDDLVKEMESKSNAG